MEVLRRRRAVGHTDVALGGELQETLGPRARLIAAEAVNGGLPAVSVIATEDRRELIDLLRDTLEPGDFVLIKGARGMRMEEIVEALRAPDQQAEGVK